MLIETERLAMRPIGLATLDEFAALHTDPELTRFIGPRDSRRPSGALGLRSASGAHPCAAMCCSATRSLFMGSTERREQSDRLNPPACPGRRLASLALQPRCRASGGRSGRA